MDQPVLPIKLPQNLIALPMGLLLDQFGGGKPTPGSGSAAALMGLLAAQLTLTVCKISGIEAAGSATQLRYLGDRLTTDLIPKLEHFFQKDADGFAAVIRFRRLRNNAVDDLARRRYRDAALRSLQRATELILEIGELCLDLVDHAIVVFDTGAKKVRGDSGAAISSAIAGALTSIFVANLNLRSFQGGRWAISIQDRINRVQTALLDKQKEALRRASALQPSIADEEQGSLFKSLP